MTMSRSETFDVNQLGGGTNFKLFPQILNCQNNNTSMSEESEKYS